MTDKQKSRANMTIDQVNLDRCICELVESAEDVDACNIQYASIDGAIKAHAEW